MATATLVSIRKGIMVLGLCASMAAASLGFSGQAEARVAEGDRMTPSATVCGAIQDLWDAAQIRKANTHVTADWNKIVREIEELESQWRRAGCGEHYGTISARVGAAVTQTFTVQADETGLENVPQENPKPANDAIKSTTKFTTLASR